MEGLFDFHEEKPAGERRRLGCISIPLCACDPYYWGYLPRRGNMRYGLYADPRDEAPSKGMEITGPFSPCCNGCKAFCLCAGTYKSAFSAFGGRIVQPYV